MKDYRWTIVAMMLVLSLPAFAQDADKLLSDMDQIIFGPKDKQGTIIIKLVNKSGSEKVREATMLQKGTDRKLYRYTQPEKQAGISTLSLPDGVMWLYMPAFGKPKKISILAKSQAFTGTDFSYEDMATTPYATRYKPEFLEETADSYKIELIPLDKKAHYSKILVSLEKNEHFPQRMEYFDRGGKKFKEATYKYQKIGKYWNAREVVMTNLKKEHSTIIELKDILFDQGLEDELFLVENLKPKEENQN
jgi:outer membrane lipoprotein-sorting protein